MFLSVNQINGSEIALRDIGDAHDFSLLQPFCANEVYPAGGTLSVTTVAEASRPEESEGVPSATPRVLYKAASVVLLDEMQRL